MYSVLHVTAPQGSTIRCSEAILSLPTCCSALSFLALFTQHNSSPPPCLLLFYISFLPPLLITRACARARTREAVMGASERKHEQARLCVRSCLYSSCCARVFDFWHRPRVSVAAGCVLRSLNWSSSIAQEQLHTLAAAVAETDATQRVSKVAAAVVIAVVR